MNTEGAKPALRTPILLVIAALVGTAIGLVFQPTPEAGETAQRIPTSLALSMVAASIIFFVSVWLMVHKALKDTKASLTILAGLVVWYGVVFFLGGLGFFGERPLFVPNVIWAFIGLYFFGRRLLSLTTIQNIFAAVPLHWIMNVQVFRVMGVGFLTLYMMGILPGEFAIPTGVGDILVGVTAPIVAHIYRSKKPYSQKLAAWWNYAGIADLALSISLGVLTYPRPLQIIPTTVSNDPIALYPLVMVPVFAVPLSLLLHFFSLRVLKRTIT